MNIYDMRLEDNAPQCGMNWPPDLAFVYKYLGVSKIHRLVYSRLITGTEKGRGVCHPRK